MAIGPLESFVFPGVLTRTITEAPSTSFGGSIRFPAFIGVAAEEIRISDYEMVRGSSAISDNLILDEDVSSQFTGLNKTFTVESFPIVTGTGTGVVASLSSHVIVTINGEAVPVASVNGLTGEVALVNVPRIEDEIRANYYFKRRDTFIENEDLSSQADGFNTSFKVNSRRVVKGDNGGTNATDTSINSVISILYNPNPAVVGDEFVKTVRVFQVWVNGTEASVQALSGSDGTFRLSSAPSAGDVVQVSYFTNTWENTYDILPAAVVNRVTKAGLSSDTSDFSVGSDCVLSGKNRLHWGNSSQVSNGLTTAGSAWIAGEDMAASLRDVKVYGRVASPVIPAVAGTEVLKDAEGNTLNAINNREFALQFVPTDGTGNGEPTEDPKLITAFVGDTWATAKAAGPIAVTKIRGSVITLGVSSAQLPDQTNQYKVYVTQYHNNIIDDQWTLTVKDAGGLDEGKYIISSRVSGYGLDVVISGGTVAPVYAGAGSVDAQVNPLRGIVERVLVVFDGVGGFTVKSVANPLIAYNPLTLDVSDPNFGKTGSVTTDGANKGYLGQTYIDPTTGFRLTLGDPGVDAAIGDMTDFDPNVSDFIAYDVGNPLETDTNRRLYVTAKSDFVLAIPGINLTVSSTEGGAVDITDNTMIVSTYHRTGNEPRVGDNYYVTFDKGKTNYNITFHTEMRDVIRLYGPIEVNNKIVVAANLAFLNGARAIALKQIKRVPGGSDASVQGYIDGIDAFNEPLPNGLRPALVQPLSSDATVHQYLKTSCAIQSSIRYRNERTAIVGFDIGTGSDEVINRLKGLSSEKITGVYPDGGVIGIADSFGNEVEYLFDGSMLAAAIAGLDCSPAFDIATTLTNKTITGFKRLYRRLDNVTAALIANAGCTVIEEQSSVIKVLMYLSTDMSNALTRDPRITEVKHFIQQGARRILTPFIGQKNLARNIPQIEGSLNSYFKNLKQNEIIVNFKPAKARISDADPSTVEVEGYYSPVFPLNWVVVTLNLRSVV